MFVFLFTLFFHCGSFFTLVAASISDFLTAAISFSCFSSNEISLRCYLFLAPDKFDTWHRLTCTGCTDGWRSYTTFVITQFSRMDSLPNFLTHGAPLARFARESSAIKRLLKVFTIHLSSPTSINVILYAGTNFKRCKIEQHGLIPRLIALSDHQMYWVL